MMLAMMLNLLLAALMGVLIPLIMTKLKRDPAVGSSMLITAISDTAASLSSSAWQRCFYCTTDVYSFAVLSMQCASPAAD